MKWHQIKDKKPELGVDVLTRTSTRIGSMEQVWIWTPFSRILCSSDTHRRTGRYIPAPEYQRLLG